MQNSNQTTMFEHGFFQRAFQEFDEKSFFQALEQRLQEQPYHRKNKGLKNTLLILSYILNVISALSASYLIYWLTATLTGIFIVACLVAGIFLFFLEKLKRKSSNEFFQVYFFQKRTAAGWLSLSFLCFVLSVGSTYFGTEQGTKDLAPESPTLSADATEGEIKAEITKLEAENTKYEKQTTKEGIIYFPLQRSIERNKEMITGLRERLTNKEILREQDNREQKDSYKNKINLTATTLAWILVFLELIFECCIAYIWYYYYRSFVEWKEIIKQQERNTPPISPSQKQMPQNLASPPPYPIGNHNGADVKNSRKPILGFLRHEKEKHQELIGSKDKTSVQACTGLYREDLHTVSHTYTKNGQKVTVHYTEQQVQARINQYKRELQEAKTKQLDKAVIENRKAWVGYWKSKFKQFKYKNIKV